MLEIVYLLKQIWYTRLYGHKATSRKIAQAKYFTWGKYYNFGVGL